MLLKSTGSLRRKRAENSPVWRRRNRGKEMFNIQVMWENPDGLWYKGSVLKNTILKFMYYD